MVLTEIPLWVTHGSNADTSSSKSAMGIASNSGSVPKAMPTTDDDEPSSSSSSTKDKDLAAAKSAVSLLQSTRGGAHRAPMYSVDVHPDGTRFATAAGDGTVKIWSMGSLFGGKFGQNNNNNNDNDNRTTADDKKRRGATSRFLDNGNYVSSNSEGYDTSSSLASSAVASGKKEQQQSKSSAATAAKSAANDLSGLVRKKKGGATSNATAAAAANQASNHNPFANNAPQSYSDSPLSRLTQRNSTTTSSNSTKDAQQQQQQLHNKLLTTISSHQGSVLALRFSTSGKYLATAGDDSYVNIYVRSNAPSLAKGNLVGVGADGGGKQVEEDVEHWNRIALCRGHQLDVVGLAWAPDDSHLVSCSLDSVHPVIVWRLFDVLNDDAAKGGDVTTSTSTNNNNTTSLTSGSVYMHNLHPFKVLGKDVHKSTVKGVAFDPAGKFIASSGDDPAICIWRASDDWGLEARIDASSGVFKSKKRKKGGAASGDNDEEEEDDPGELASLSMFRRISFAPDGSHVCGTNATLKGKNIAAMISREGWAASGPNPKSASSSQGGGGGDDDESHHHPPGAANLVGHKQPVVSSRHCPLFFQAPSSKRKRPPSAEEASSGDSDSEDDDGGYEPEYATLVALGDKRGFVTVWSTKSSRPIFKMQCSESRCAVTDISWGLVRSSKGDDKDSLIMIVSLLDGFVVALHFSIPAEVGGGRLLSSEKTKRIFRVKYGIDDGGKRLVDDSGPALIENALQFTMEMEANDTDGDNMSDSSKASVQRDQRNVSLNASNGSIRDTQVISTKKGKKRIAPVLLTANGSVAINVSDEDGIRSRNKKSKTSNDHSSDPLQNALNAAEIAASAAEGVAASNATNVNNGAAGASQKQDQQSNVVSTVTEGKFSQGEVRIPYNQNRVLTTELVTTNKSSASGMFETEERSTKVVADCVNSAPVSTGVSSWPFTTLSISRGGVRGWKDIIAKTTCTSLVANEKILVVGTANGCIYLYGTSPTLGWESGKAFRAFPPYVLGSPVVAINLSPASSDESGMVVVTSDGGFSVYNILESGPKLVYKGSIVPPMQHMLLSSTSANQRGVKQPKLVRIQITESKRLMLVLMLPTATVGRALQGFVYNRDMESWMLVSDSNNFLLSDFYSPIHKVNIGKEGILSRIDKIVTSSASTMASAKQMYQRVVENEKHSYQHIITRSHCEDRLACSIALESRSEFESWLALYARCLSSSGEAEALRFLVDALLNDSGSNGDFMVDGSDQNVPSFLSVGINRLGLDGKQIIRQKVLPEMSKNRHMQRLTNEISIELDNF